MFVVALPLGLLHRTDGDAGFLSAAIGVGGIIGAFAAAGFAERRAMAEPMGLGLALFGLSFATIAIAPSFALAVVCLIGNGLGNSVVDTSGYTLLSRSVHDQVLARVLGVVETLPPSRWPSARSWLPPRHGARARARPAAREPPVRTAPAPHCRAARRAGRTRPLRRRRGPDAAGEAADCAYAIERGTLRVVADGREVALLERPDVAGEMGLLRGAPRTATVTAVGAVDALRLDEDDFLAAIGGHPVASTRADELVAARWAALRSANAD